MTTPPDLKLYIKAGCPWCRIAEDYLRKHGYTYRTVDVRVDRKAYAELQRISKQTYAPTLVVNDELVLPDFGPEELEEFLREHQITPGGTV